MGVLTTAELQARLRPPEDPHDLGKWLAVTPLLDVDQVSNSSIDLRLGTHFTLTRTTRVRTLDAFAVADRQSARNEIRSYQRQIIVPYGSDLILHPGDFVLGTTIEYLRVPMDLCAYVMGRSSWGRLGLIIATAVVVHPGFAGCITLELVNEGSVPIALRPGVRICQLAVHSTSGEEDDHPGPKYMGQVLSEYSRIYEDKELPLVNALTVGP